MSEHEEWFNELGSVARAAHLHYVHGLPERLPATDKGLVLMHDDQHGEGA